MDKDDAVTYSGTLQRYFWVEKDVSVLTERTDGCILLTNITRWRMRV